MSPRNRLLISAKDDVVVVDTCGCRCRYLRRGSALCAALAWGLVAGGEVIPPFHAGRTGEVCPSIEFARDFHQSLSVG